MGGADEPTANELILQHEWLVISVVLNDCGLRVVDGRCDDLFAAGALGLVVAANRFRRELGSPFVSYARRCIRGAIMDEMRRDRRHAAVPVGSFQHLEDKRGLEEESDSRLDAELVRGRAAESESVSAFVESNDCIYRGATCSVAAGRGVSERRMRQIRRAGVRDLRRIMRREARECRIRLIAREPKTSS